MLRLNYLHNKASKRFGDDFLKTVDDGDIDDNHAYYNWYDYSVFRFFNGEFQKQFKSPGRPLISQEMSTGYPNAETGHPTRSYQLIHQNPYSLIGYEAYDWGNPPVSLIHNRSSRESWPKPSVAPTTNRLRASCTLPI